MGKTQLLIPNNSQMVNTQFSTHMNQGIIQHTNIPYQYRNQPKKVTCFRCGEIGHIQRNCNIQKKLIIPQLTI